MVAKQNAASLTKAVIHSTNLPFPKSEIIPCDTASPNNNGPTSRIVYDQTDKLLVSVCSEFTEYVEAASPVAAQQRIAVIHDDQGNPIILSIGNDYHLYTIRHVPGAEAWESVDITPLSSDSGKIKLATAFDAVQDVRTGKVNLVVSVVEIGSGAGIEGIDSKASEIYAVVDVEAKAGQPLITVSQWYHRPSIKDYVVTSIRVSSASTTHSRSSGINHPFAIVGTAQSDQRNASEYRVDLDAGLTTDIWSDSALGQVSAKVVTLEAALLPMPFKDGSFALFQSSNAADGVVLAHGSEAADQCTFHSRVIGDAAGYHIDILLQDIGGAAYDLAAVPNQSQNTDLLVAGQSGLGFYRADKMGSAPTVFLPGIVFRQVFAAQTDLRISVLAVSDHGGLYFAEGVRDKPEATPVFTSSGLPIRQAVQHLAVQRDSVYSTTNVIYSNDENHLVHLSRDTTGNWVEQRIFLADGDGKVHYPAYLSNINFTSVAGHDAPPDYPINIISSEVVRCLINGRNHILSSTPTEVKTDTWGSLFIVTQTPSTLAFPQYTLKLQHGTSTFDVPICPAQSILTKWAAVKSVDDLLTSTNTKGQPTTISKIHPDKLKHVVPILSQLGNIFTKGIPHAVENLGNSLVDAGQEFVVAFERVGDEWRDSPPDDGTWAGAAREVVDFLGDLFETVATAITATVKIMIRFSESMFMFYVEVGGTIIKFLANTLGTCVRGLALILKNLLNIDLTGLLDWVGYVTDMENIKSTVEVMTRFTKNGIILLGDTMDLNVAYFQESLSLAKTIIKLAIPDFRHDNPVLPDDLKPSTILKEILGWVYDIIFNNPIQKVWRELLERILSSLIGPLPDMIGVPGIEEIFDIVRDTAGKIFGAGAKAIFDFIDDIADKFVKLLTNQINVGEFMKELFADGFWEVFDLLTDAFMAVFAAIGPLLRAFAKLLADPWKIPYITKLWEFTTGMDLSIMNVILVPLAVILNMVTLATHEELPFDVYGDPSLRLPTPQSCALDIKDLESVRKLLEAGNLLPKDNSHNGVANIASFAPSVDIDGSKDPEITRLVAVPQTPMISMSAMNETASDTPQGQPPTPQADTPTTNQPTPEETAEKEKAEKEKAEKEQKRKERLRWYRLVDAGCGTTNAVLSAANVGLEFASVAPHKLGKKDRVEPVTKSWEMKEMSSTPKGLTNEDGIVKLGAQAEQVPGQYLGGLRHAVDVKIAQQGLLAALKALMLTTGTAANVTSVVALSRMKDLDLPDYHLFIALKSAGLIISAIASVIGLYLTARSEGAAVKLISAVSGIFNSIGNILSTPIPGFVEFNHAVNKDGFASSRVSGDSFELAAQISSGVAFVAHACEQLEVTAGALCVEGGFTYATIPPLGIAIAAYVKNQSLE